MHGSRGGGGLGVRTHLENHKNIGVLAILGPDPLEITKLPSSIQCRAINGPLAKRHLNGVSLGGR